MNSFDKVKSIDSEIRQHKERNIQREMDKIKEANDKLMDKQKQIMVDRDALTKRIDTLKDELAKQDVSYFTFTLPPSVTVSWKHNFLKII